MYTGKARFRADKENEGTRGTNITRKKVDCQDKTLNCVSTDHRSIKQEQNTRKNR